MRRVSYLVPGRGYRPYPLRDAYNELAKALRLQSVLLVQERQVLPGRVMNFGAELQSVNSGISRNGLGRAGIPLQCTQHVKNVNGTRSAVPGEHKVYTTATPAATELVGNVINADSAFSRASRVLVVGVNPNHDFVTTLAHLTVNADVVSNVPLASGHGRDAYLVRANQGDELANLLSVVVLLDIGIRPAAGRDNEIAETPRPSRRQREHSEVVRAVSTPLVCVKGVLASVRSGEAARSPLTRVRPGNSRGRAFLVRHRRSLRYAGSQPERSGHE